VTGLGVKGPKYQCTRAPSCSVTLMRLTFHP